MTVPLYGKIKPSRKITTTKRIGKTAQAERFSMHNLESVRIEVQAGIQELLEQTNRPRKSLEDDDLLFADVGLDSLDLAQVVVSLEQRLKVDPFRKSGVTIRTFGDLVRAYQKELES